MIIISQDRDNSVTFRKGNKIEGVIIVQNGMYMGINLIVNTRLMGTFNTYEEVEQEINNILNCKYEFYIVNGFSDYENCFGGEYND